MTGYSKRSLLDKLGIKPGMRLAILNAPPGYELTLGPLPDGVIDVAALRGPLDFIHFFSKSRAEFERMLPSLKAHLTPAGMLWISWPKAAAKVPTDLGENIIRDRALALGLVDIKVAAIDATWSGLKLVIPVQARRAMPSDGRDDQPRRGPPR